MRVFIVDDDRDHAESIADVLAVRGHHVEVAFSGESGVTRFRQADFDLVFMDVRLPGMSGVETFFEFRKIRPHAKIMLMTAYSLEELIAQAIENGALGVLRKPFDVRELLDVLDRVKPRGMVLVADDDPEVAASIETILAAHGYSVEIARTGEEALQKVADNGVNCLVLDMRMPVLSGMEVYLKLKDIGRLLPTIFITGFPNEQHGAFARLGDPFARGILLKPIVPSDLLAAVDAATA
jgi:two-component system response regulator HydG